MAAGGGHLGGGGVDAPHGAAQLHLQVAHGQQDVLEFAHIGVPVGGLDVEVFVGHFGEQVADVVDDGVQPGHHVRRGLGELGGLIPAAGLGDGGLQIAGHQQLHPFAHRPHGPADVGGQAQGHRDGGQGGGRTHQDVDEDAHICIGEVVLLHGGDGHAPAVGATHGGVGRVPGPVGVVKAAEAVFPLAHLGVDGGQLLQGAVVLGVPLHVLGGDGLQGDVGDGVAVFVNHVSAAVFTHLDGGHNVVQKGLRRYKVDHAHNAVSPAPVGIEGGGHHDGQLAGNFADEGLGHIDSALHGLLDILPVGGVLAVENAQAVGADDIAPLEAVHGGPLVNDGPLGFQRGIRVGQLGDAAGVHGHVFVGGELLLNPLRGQHGGFAHHLVHCGDGAAVVEGDAGGAHQYQRG